MPEDKDFIEIIFKDSSTPKIIRNIKSAYTKGLFYCIQQNDGLIIKYPIFNIFSVCCYHKKHLGSTSGVGD